MSVAALAMVALADMAGLHPAGAQAAKPAAAKEAAPKPGAAVFDFLRTDARRPAVFKFQGPLTLPAGFFGEGSKPLKAVVTLRGVPLGTFRDHQIGAADVIIARQGTPALSPPFPKTGKADIELAALSLESVKPLAVATNGKMQNWDVKVRLSTSHASTGTMTIMQRTAAGGVASWQLAVYPVFTFVPQGGGQEKQLDVGAMKLAPATVEGLTVRAANVPWAPCPPNAHQVPDIGDSICLGVSPSGGGGGAAGIYFHNGSFYISHWTGDIQVIFD